MDDERRRKLCVEWNYLINFFSDRNDVNCLLAYFAKKNISLQKRLLMSTICVLLAVEMRTQRLGAFKIIRYFCHQEMN